MTTADEFIAAAASEVGYHEDPPKSNETKFALEAGEADGQPWCATFLIAIAHRVGLKLPGESAYTPSLADDFKRAHQWVSVPQRGDFVFYDFPDASHRIQHVGVVERVRPDGKIETIEGNTSLGNDSNGGSVMRRVRSQASVVGYGRPVYTNLPPQPHPPAAPKGPDMAHVVDALNDPAGGAWVLQDDGGVFTFHGANYYGSYPGLNIDAGNKRTFGTIQPRPDGGYDLVATSGEVYQFPKT